MHHSFRTNASQFSTNASQFSINASQFSTFSNKVLELLQSYGSLAGVWRMAASGHLPSWAIQQHLKKSTTLPCPSTLHTYSLTIVLISCYLWRYYILPWLLTPFNTSGSLRHCGKVVLWYLETIRFSSLHCSKVACSDVRGQPVTMETQKSSCHGSVFCENYTRRMVV